MRKNSLKEAMNWFDALANGLPGILFS